MPNRVESQDGRLWSSLCVSVLFFIVYFFIHYFLNIYTGPGPHVIDFDPHQLVGPFTISLCSSLLIFSLGSFISQGMRHLSIIVPGVFFNAFMIFVLSQILVQIAGHAEIFSLSGDDTAAVPLPIRTAIKFLSVVSVPVTFLSLLWLEMYQARVYRVVHDRLPEVAARRHGNPTVILLCTGASVLVSILEHGLEEYRWVFIVETGLAIVVVFTTFRGGGKAKAGGRA
jgi:hypothetical protein